MGNMQNATNKRWPTIRKFFLFPIVSSYNASAYVDDIDFIAENEEYLRIL